MELGELDVRRDRRGDVGIEAAGPHLPHGCRSGSDGEAERLVELQLVDDRREELREEDIPRADSRHGLYVRSERPNPAGLLAEAK
jgi:hypothetical protein